MREKEKKGDNTSSNNVLFFGSGSGSFSTQYSLESTNGILESRLVGDYCKLPLCHG